MSERPAGRSLSSECSSPCLSPAELGAGCFPRLLFVFRKLAPRPSRAPWERAGEGSRPHPAFPRVTSSTRCSQRTPSSPPLAPTGGATCSRYFRFSLAKATSQDTQPVLMTTCARSTAMHAPYLHTERRPVGGSTDAPMMPPHWALCPLLFLPGCSWGACLPLVGCGTAHEVDGVLVGL